MKALSQASGEVNKNIVKREFKALTCHFYNYEDGPAWECGDFTKKGNDEKLMKCFAKSPNNFEEG